MPANAKRQAVTIPNAGTTSPEIDLKGFVPVGIWMPAALTGTTLTFTVSKTSGGTFTALAGVSVTFAANGYVVIDHTKFYGLRYVKLVSNGTEAAARAFELACRGTGLL